jgi:hypothetical protein
MLNCIRIALVFPIDTGNPDKIHTATVNITDLPRIIYPLLEVAGLYQLLIGEEPDIDISEDFDADEIGGTGRFGFYSKLIDVILGMAINPGPYINAVELPTDSTFLHDGEESAYRRDVYLTALMLLGTLAKLCKEYPKARISVSLFPTEDEKLAAETKRNAELMGLADEIGPI